MNPVEYCERSVAAPGSSVYYAAWTLGTDAVARQQFLAGMALAKALRECAEADLDKPAALAKVGYWADELGALLGGEPTHPVAQAMQPGLAVNTGSTATLQEAVRATGEVVELLPAEDLRLAERLAQATCGDLLAIASGHACDESAPARRHAGAAHQLAERLVRLATDPSAWRVLPEAARVRAPDGDHERALREYIRQTCDAVVSHADAALAANVGPPPARALASIARATARRVAKRGHDVLEGRVDLSPVHKLCLAWRAR